MSSGDERVDGWLRYGGKSVFEMLIKVLSYLVNLNTFLK
jgi:hypothetical protein